VKETTRHKEDLKMKKMTDTARKIALAALSAVVAAALAGCSSDDNTKKTTSKTKKERADITEKAGKDTEIEIMNSFSSDIHAGDFVIFGNYEQDNDTTNGAEPIKWQVLEVSDGKALLISKHVLDKEEYNESEAASGDENSTSLRWNQSHIRNWLNNEFSNSAFCEGEKEAIADMTDYSVKDETGAFSGEMIDGVFFLSYDEVMKYFSPATDGDGKTYDIYSMDLLCEATPYAKHNSGKTKEEFTKAEFNKLTKKGFVYDESVVGNKYSSWWLRTDYSLDSWFTAEGHAMVVEHTGRVKIGTFGLDNEKDFSQGVRPCVWVDLDMAEDLITVTDGTDEEWMIPVEKEVNCTWEIDGNRLIINGDEIPNAWKGDKAPWLESAATITEVEINGIEKIPNKLFYKLDSLQKIILGDATKEAKHSAFDDLPDGVVIVYQGQEYDCESINDVL
jgi:hypothetical protein